MRSRTGPGSVAAASPAGRLTSVGSSVATTFGVAALLSAVARSAIDAPSAALGPDRRPELPLLGSRVSSGPPLELRPGAGILMGVSFASGQGINLLLVSMLLGGSLGLLDPLDHRAALEALARPEFHWWRATPHFADVLGRIALTRPDGAPAPQFAASATAALVTKPIIISSVDSSPNVTVCVASKP